MDEEGYCAETTLNSRQQHHHSIHIIIMISLCLLMILSSYLTSAGISISLYYSYYYFSTVFLPLLVSTSLDRNYVFLVCNGIILLFLLGLLLDQHPHSPQLPSNDDCVLLHAHATSTSRVQEDHQVALDDQLQLQKVDQRGVLDVTSFLEEEEEEDSSIEEEEEEGKKYDEEEEEGKKYDEEEEQGSVDHKEVIVLTTDDELKNKFDEFIRKMKEDLRLQALMDDYHLIPAA